MFGIVRQSEELLSIVYSDNDQQLQADLASIAARYRAAMGDDYRDHIAFSELVAAKAEEILGNEQVIKRLAAEKPCIAARIWQTLKDFAKKLTGVKSTEADRIRKAEELYRKALKEARKNPQQQTEGTRFALEANPAADGMTQFSYEYLTNQPDMPVTRMPDPQLYCKGKGADRLKAKADGIKNADSMKSAASSGNRLFVDNAYTGTPLQINTAAIQHGITGSPERQLRNAAAGAAIGRLAANAIPVNELIHKKVESQPWVSKEYLYLSIAEDDTSYYPVALVVQTTDENLGAVTHIEALEGIKKRYIYSVNAHQHEKGTGYEDMTANSSSTSTGSTISIANRLDLVKDDFADGFSADVLQQLGLTRPSGPFADGTKFADPAPVLPSEDILAAGMAAFHERMASPPVPPTDDGSAAGNSAERQFNAQTAQRSQAIPEWLKQVLWQNRFYERDSNRAQAERAWQRISAEGYEATRERLLNMNNWGTDENVEALIMLHMALRPVEYGGMGDPRLAMGIALRNGEEGTKQGQALQARQLFSRMTPLGMYTWAAGSAEASLRNFLDSHQPIANRVHQHAGQVEQQIEDLDNTDPLTPDENGDVVITPESVQEWGTPINAQQQALIDHYHLNNVARPGLFYNKATLRQRMLEAILATPDPTAQTGLGMNLIERLELMQEGAPVVTEVDLDYIVEQMEQYAFASEEDQNGRLGDLALARAYEAYGNITPATLRERSRTWRYTSMLLSLPSAFRNIIGNTAQGTANAASHGVAVELDRFISLFTGQRTMAHNTVQDYADGFHAFVEETVNTYRDFFVDRAETRRGNDRFNMHQRGRVFQWQIPEALRTLEGFIMSVGDRNVWRRAFVQSMAEQQHVADINGTEFDVDAALERAVEAANYATFSEDSDFANRISALKQNRHVGWLFDFIIPFHTIPTNIVRRMGQFSPFGLAWSVGQAISYAWNGQTFDQHAVANGIARGLTGTAMYAAGMLLYHLGVIRLGTGEEDDKEYALHTAMGSQYTPYIRIGDQYVNLSALAPFISPLIMGASSLKIFEEAGEGEWGNALMSAAIAAGDQIFDASYMSNLSDILGGYGSNFENILLGVGSSMISQNIPSILGQLASALDPYVRDTRDRDKVRQILNTGLINKLPWLRQYLLPAKVDVAGRRIENTDYGPIAFFDPFNRTIVHDDPALIEVDRLQDVLGTTSHLPSDALSGSRTALTGVAVPVEGENKEAYKVRYGELWRLGGATYDADGNPVVIMGVADLIQTPWYKRMTDAEKANAISGVMSAAKAGAIYETGELLGHTPKSTGGSGGSATVPVRAVPAQLEGRYPQLDRMFKATGDGTFIPKGINGSFSRNKVQYDLSGRDYDVLWELYISELDLRLGQINFDGDPDEVATAVNAAYSSAAADAKDNFAKLYPTGHVDP